MTNFTKIINDFVNKMGYQENEDVEGIVYYGSSQTGYSNNFSDIDLHIIFNNNLEQSIRGSMTIDEVRVEYFEKSISTMYKKALTEFKNQANAMVSMIEYGTIIFDRNGKIKTLQEYVHELYSLPMPCIEDEQAKELIAIINNFFDDLKNCIESNDLYSTHIYHLTLERIKDFYFSYYGLPGVARTKALKTMLNDGYRNAIKKENPPQEFIELYLKCLDESILIYERFVFLQELFEYCTKDVQFDKNNFRIRVKK